MCLLFAERRSCFPNPCKHNGVCIIAGEKSYICNCDNTGYTGKECNILLIDAPEFSAIALDSPTEFMVSAWPDRSFMLEMIPDSKKFVKVNPSSVTFSVAETSWNISILVKKPGMYKLEYRIGDGTLYYQPIPPATLLVSDGNSNQSDYFIKHKVENGLLQQGCCSASEEDIKLISKCPDTDNKITFTSTCGWTSKANLYSSGIIFSTHNGLNMPIAIAGAKLQITRNYINLQNLNSKDFNCNECSGSTGNTLLPTEPCDIEKLTVVDVQKFLDYESLAHTYLHHAMSLIPGWLELTAMQSNRIHNINSYMTQIVYPDDLKALEACNHLTALSDGVFSVLLYSGSLKIKLSKEVKQIQSNAPICFATNLCKGSSSPFYMTIPEEIQSTIESFEFMSDLRSKGWIINISNVIISNSLLKTMTDDVLESQIWNGINYTLPQQKATNLVADLQFIKNFYLMNRTNCTLTFSGTTHWLNEKLNKVCGLKYSKTFFTLLKGGEASH